jgi:hypothetical protein
MVQNDKAFDCEAELDNGYRLYAVLMQIIL